MLCKRWCVGQMNREYSPRSYWEPFCKTMCNCVTSWHTQEYDFFCFWHHLHLGSSNIMKYTNLLFATWWVQLNWADLRCFQKFDNKWVAIHIHWPYEKQWFWLCWVPTNFFYPTLTYFGYIILVYMDSVMFKDIMWLVNIS